jgi:hypothetical protein
MDDLFEPLHNKSPVARSTIEKAQLPFSGPVDVSAGPRCDCPNCCNLLAGHLRPVSVSRWDDQSRALDKSVGGIVASRSVGRMREF